MKRLSRLLAPVERRLGGTPALAQRRLRRAISNSAGQLPRWSSFLPVQSLRVPAFLSLVGTYGLHKIFFAVGGAEEPDRLVPVRSINELSRLLFPGQPLDPAQDRCLLLAGHQDDEAISGSRLLHEIGEIYVQHLTDGSPADPSMRRPPEFPDRASYGALRDAEVVDALSLSRPFLRSG